MTEGRVLDPSTSTAVTRALDIAIARVAAEDLTRLSAGLSREDIAAHICKSLRALQQLEGNIKPNYNEWVAVFYSLWYQPAQINLAYTLARTLPHEINPIMSRDSALQVFDFGCGALAMKFGLALAASNVLHESGNLHRIIVQSEDESPSMKAIGEKIWDKFLGEIEIVADRQNTSELVGVWLACEDIICDGSASSAETPLWLTVLHVAYGKSSDKIKKDLKCSVEISAPDLVLVTSHPRFARYRFRPQYDRYGDEIDRWAFCPGEPCLGRRRIPCVGAPCSERLELKGKLCVTTEFRSRLYKFIRDSIDYSERSFADRFLTKHPTYWTGIQPLEAVAYVRQP